MEKSQFLRLAYHAQARGVTDCYRLDVVEAEVQHLRGELEASQRSREERFHQES